MFGLVNIVLFILVFIVVLIIIYAFFVLSNLNKEIKHLEEENERREDYILELEVENEKTMDILRKMGDSIRSSSLVQ
uniref:Uncharacterized protein n=1 Tax=Pithovirus LCPAC101 TaxID=2506586 RepID=A0A481Z4P0_9VIRU|nr:MAG: hypothetical protein LCPAC101_02620 [Pithovirus LCPAC101]